MKSTTILKTAFACAPATIASALSMAAIATATMALGEVIYENDFSTRTSAGAVPYGEWREVPYSTGAFLNDNYNSPFSGNALQDNWIRGKNSCDCPTQIVSDNGNPEVVMFNAAGVNKHVIVKHRIGNTFTNGTVTAQCDFRAPTTWTGYSLIQDFILGDERFFSPETDTANGGGVFLNYRAARGGVVHDGSSRKFTVLESSGSVKENTILANTESWYRLVISVNLDTRKYSCAFYDLGTEHPTLETPTPETAAFSRSGVDIVNEAVTSISAIGLDCYSPHGGSDPSSLDLSQAGQFDNVRVSHNGVECYVNDFAKRRSRALFGTATATYAADCLVTNTVWTETYAAGVSFYKAAVNNKNISQPVGIDGWRRLNSDLPVTPTVYSDDGNYTMQFGDYTKTGVGATTLGQTLTTGKVRASVDVRATGIAGSGTGQSISMILGSDELYSANYSQFGANNGWFAIGGIVGTQQSIDGATYRRPAYKTSSGWVYPSGENEWVKQGTWLRYTVEADLDSGTYSFTIRDQGTTHPGGDAADGETVFYSKSGIASVKAVTSISSLALTAYNSSVMYDNIKVWHRPTGASAETLVYDNRFTTRTIYYQDFREGQLVGTIMNEPVGQDGWTRANTGVMKAVLRADDANQALTFGNGKDTLAYAMHDIGKLCRSGKMTTQVDVCPPCGWLGGNRITLFWLGGDRFHEGNLKTGDAFYQHAATMFGFRDVAGTAGTGAVYTNVTLCAYNGDGAGGGSYVDSSLAVDPTHWYRFVATTMLDEGKSDIAVYDMGATHPTLATATPATPVETFTGVKFRQAAANVGGVSSLCISGMGTMDNTLDLSAGVFWDNIRIDFRNSAFIIVVR